MTILMRKPKAAPLTAAANEHPQYEALAEALNGQWGQVRASFATLRRAWFAALGLGDPKETSLRGRLVQSWKQAGKDALTQTQVDNVDAAIERFLGDFRGPSAGYLGFTDPNGEQGQVQESVFLAHRVGAGRAIELLNADIPNPELAAGQRRVLLEQSFARLSENGRLRFEKRLDEIRQAMIDGAAAGDSPLKVAADLGRNLSGYEQGRLRTITRTEMAVSAETATREMYRQHGVSRVEVIGDPNTDETCTDRIGNTYSIDDLENQPPLHPNCYCSCIPVIDTEGQSFVRSVRTGWEPGVRSCAEHGDCEAADAEYRARGMPEERIRYQHWTAEEQKAWWGDNL
jgi:SPP1 gp7 family putative phage head morphogenesis protein